MAKIKIPEELKGKDLFSFLVQHKKALIDQKKAFPKCAANDGGAVSFETSIYLVSKEGQITKAAAGAPELLDADTIRVKTVSNTAFWCDTVRDVTIPDCWNKSVKERKHLLKHLKDHRYSMDAELGDVVDSYPMEMSWSDLGVNFPGKTQVLVFESDIYKSYDEKMFNRYKAKKVKQHSIGLIYVVIKLAINDPDYKEEYATWTKYIDKIANQDYVQEGGYFWALEEIKVIENSAVLFGANSITPTLEVEDKSNNDDTDEEPEGTQDEPPTTTTQPSDPNKSMLSQIGSGLKKESVFATIGKQF